MRSSRSKTFGMQTHGLLFLSLYETGNGYFNFNDYCDHFDVVICRYEFELGVRMQLETDIANMKRVCMNTRSTVHPLMNLYSNDELFRNN